MVREKSEMFGTPLTIGPRLKKFMDAGLASKLLWEEDYPDQEGATTDGRGQFQRTREWIETAQLEAVFDLWLRGNNLIGYSSHLLYAVPLFIEICNGVKP